MMLEDQLKKLEEIAHKLESSELPLDEAITLFEEGVGLATSIREALNAAKLRIEAVTETAGDSFSIEPFDLESR